MLLGLLMPLLRRFGARTRMLIGAAVMVAGLALVLTLVLRGHAPGGSVLLIRIGLLLALAGVVPFASGMRRSQPSDQPPVPDPEQPGDQA
jgi:hypothetical protein